MRSHVRLLAVCICALAVPGLTAVAVADPGEGHADDIPAPPITQPAAPPGISENAVEFLDAIPNDGTTNSDLAFYGDLAYVGFYDGFRIVDISNPADLKVVSETRCRANQGDLSVFATKDGRRILLQSIDRPVTAPDCSATDTAVVQEDEGGHTVDRRRFGYEGLRVFDVTAPKNPEYIGFYRTECGSHTHTLVPDKRGDKVFAYVASYPLTTNITPEIDWDVAGDLRCDPPHSKISVVGIPLDDPTGGEVTTRKLSSDTEFYDGDGPDGHSRPFQSCHDHQAFLARDIMVASCAGDLQYWDISKRGNPSSADGEAHTHIQREVAVDDPSTPDNERWESFDFMHNATVTWDGAVVAAVDESGGGVEPRCDGAASKRGFTWFYPLVEPGQPVDAFDELGRYMIPRPQGENDCVSHNGNVLPLSNGRYQQVQAFYFGGNSWFDFSNQAAANEIGYADLTDPPGGIGDAGSWSTYWYNDVMYVNGGLGGTENRGFEAYRLKDPVTGVPVDTRDWSRMNPQTQEAWQAP